MSPKVLYGGLAALLVIFLGVIFLLPSAVEDTSRQESATEPAVSQGAEETTTAGDSAILSDAPGNKNSVEPPLDSSAERGQGSGNFSENIEDLSGDSAALTKAATDEALGDLLSRLEVLQFRAIDRWGGQPYLDMLVVYAEGDKAYVNRNYTLAGSTRDTQRRINPAVRA